MSRRSEKPINDGLDEAYEEDFELEDEESLDEEVVQKQFEEEGEAWNEPFRIEELDQAYERLRLFRKEARDAANDSKDQLDRVIALIDKHQSEIDEHYEDKRYLFDNGESFIRISVSAKYKLKEDKVTKKDSQGT